MLLSMSAFFRVVFLLIALLLLSPASASARGSVFVFGEVHFPKSGSAAPVSAKKTVAALRQAGVEAHAIDANGLESPSFLEDAASSVLVLASGNVFPKAAFANLREFHRKGGSLVMSGVPFSHPCEQLAGKWTDLGHQNFFAHGDHGIGTGGFKSAQPAQKWELQAPESPLALPQKWFSGMEGRTQWLDVGSLDPRDEVVPLFSNVKAGQAPQPAAALIRHRCETFSGACDVWLGHLLGGEDERDVFLATQLLTRGVLWCLHEKRQLSAESFQTKLAVLNKIELPGPLPAGLVAMESPMPWGDSFVPKSAPPRASSGRRSAAQAER
jgi:hypothetical protein